jgi:integrase
VNGHLRQRSSNSWEIRWRANGKVSTRTVKGGKREAEKALRAALVAVDKGQHVAPAKTTVDQFLAERIALWQCSGATREHYEGLGKLIDRHLGRIPLQKLTARDIERWHAEAGVAPSTLRHAHGLLVRVLSDAQRHKLVHANVAKEQPPPRAPAAKVRVPTEDLLVPMLEALRGSEFHIPVVLTVNTGLRRSELLALRWSDVDLDKATGSRLSSDACCWAQGGRQTTLWCSRLWMASHKALAPSACAGCVRCGV